MSGWNYQVVRYSSEDPTGTGERLVMLIRNGMGLGPQNAKFIDHATDCGPCLHACLRAAADWRARQARKG